MAHSFTVEYSAIENKLITPIMLIGNGQETKAIALWDTGATRSCISQEIATKLGLATTGFQLIQTPSGSSKVNIYCLDMILPNNVKVSGIPVCGTEIGKQGFDVLIGMDIITHGDFQVSNFDGKTMFGFRFPSVENVDMTGKDSKAIAALKNIESTKDEAST